MQIFYSNVKLRGISAVTSTERTAMRHAMIDYGALQQSPVGESDPISDIVSWSIALRQRIEKLIAL
jgi:hypothetical protein